MLDAAADRLITWAPQSRSTRSKLETATGKPVWSAATGKAWGMCVVADGVLYYGSADGTLYALGRE